MLAGSCAKPARSGNAASTAATSNPNVTGARRAAALPPPGRRRGRMREREDDGDSADGGAVRGGGCGVADGRRQPVSSSHRCIVLLAHPLSRPTALAVVAAGPRPPLPPVRSPPPGCRRPSTLPPPPSVGCRRPSATPPPPPLAPPRRHPSRRRPPASSSWRWPRCCSPHACHVRGGRGSGARGVPRPRRLRAATHRRPPPIAPRRAIKCL